MAAHFIIVNGSLYLSYQYYLNWFWESFIGSTREVDIDIFQEIGIIFHIDGITWIGNHVAMRQEARQTAY